MLIVEIVDMLNVLKKEGKICFIGVVNVDVGYIREYFKYGELDIIQVKYSIFDWVLEGELLLLCWQNGIIVQVYLLFEQGLLIGIIGWDYVFGGVWVNKVWFQWENMLWVMDMFEEWWLLCVKYYCMIFVLVLVWILKQSDLIILLSGVMLLE